MKVLTQIANGKSQQHNNDNNVVRTNRSNSLTRAQNYQQAAVNDTKESSEMNLRANSCSNDYKYNINSLETPKPFNSSNHKNGNKSNSHTYYNIPTTTNISSHKKYYQQHHHRYNQQHHNFLNNSKDNQKYKYTTTKINAKLEADITRPTDTQIACKQNQKLAQFANASLKHVEDFVNNNTISKDYNSLELDKSILDLSSHSAKSEFKQYIPSTLPPTSGDDESLLLTAETLPPQHNCIGENSSIDLDCNSCWTNLVTPPSINLELQAPWSWTHVSRYKSSSVSSTSSTHSSTASTSITALAESKSSEILHDSTSVTECESNVNKSKSRKKKVFRKNSISNRRSSPPPKERDQLQRAPSNTTSTLDGIQNIKYSSVVSATDVSIGTEIAAMTTTSTSTVSTNAATNSTIDSTVKKATLLTEHANTSTVRSTNIVTAKELSTLPVTSTTACATINNCETTSNNSPSTVTLTSSAPATTSSASVSTNSYTLDFLHSVGEQMTGGVNVSPFSKSSTTTMRENTTFNNENSCLVSPARNSSYSSYQNVGTNRPPHTTGSRHMSSSGEVVDMVHNNGIQTREQRVHRFHQPHPLTLGAFMQKELMNETLASGGALSRGTNSGNNVNGSGDSGRLDVNNNNSNEDYTNHQSSRNHNRYHHNYYQSHYQQTHQPRLTPLQRGFTNAQSSYHSEIGNDGGTYIVRNGSSSNQRTQHSKNYHTYQSQQNNEVAASNYSYRAHHNSLLQEDDSGIGVGNEDVGNEISDAVNRNSNHFRSAKQPQQKLANTKKSNYVSSSTSSCSSSSSASSNCSQASTTSYRQQKAARSTSKMNLVIETLPRNNNALPSHRNHRLQQSNYQNQHHSLQPFSTGICAPHASTAQQLHQNIHNLTYVNTETHANVGIQSRSCSPTIAPPPTSSTPVPHSSAQDTSTLMLNQYTPNFFHERPQQPHQQNYMHDKRLTPSHSTSPTTVGNMICYAASCDSSQSSKNVAQGSTISHDYDDSDSSSTNSVTLSQQRVSQQQSHSVSVSSSSSTSSLSSTTAIRNYNVTQQQQGVTMVALPPHIQSPAHTEFAYNTTTFAATSQQYTLQAQALASPQQQPTHFRNNGIISMFNVSSLSNNNCTDDELKTMKQTSITKQQGIHNQQRHFYFTSGEHLNATPLSAHVANGGYWSPFQHSNFVYPPPANFMPTATATLSPSLSDHDDHHHHSHTLLNQQHQMNIVKNQSEPIPPASHLKRSSTQQIGYADISQQQLQHHRIPQSTVATATASVASLRQRSGGRSQQQQMSALPPPLTPSISHVYTQHNLLFSGPQTHIRSSVNASHEFFTHTPPDRFLARAHLIEAKETPNTLLNNSKWDNLSQGIWNKFINSQQTEETFKQKMRLWRYLYIIIKNTYPRFGLYLVGSTISGFGADTSDVDMCLVSRSASTVEPRMEALINLTVLRDYLCKSAEFENFNLIEAKVPILRFRDRVHQLEVDLNFNNCVGIKNTHLLYCYSQLDWRLRPMVLVTKLWAQYHNINNAKTMTISSYSLVLMVIHFLQYAVRPAVLPCLHDIFPEKFPLLRSNDFGFVDMNETMSPYDSKNTQTIGELFLSFLEYYSCFDYTQFAISIRTGGLLPINVCRLAKSLKNDIHQWKELCIEEPFDLTNTARSVYDFDTFERVKAVFVASWRILQQTLDLNTIFAPIIIPPMSNVPQTLSTGCTQYNESTNKTGSTDILNRENAIPSSASGATIVKSHDMNAQASVPIDNTEEHINDHEIYNTNKGENQTASGTLTELVS